MELLAFYFSTLLVTYVVFIKGSTFNCESPQPGVPPEEAGVQELPNPLLVHGQLFGQTDLPVLIVTKDYAATSSALLEKKINIFIM